LPGSVHGVVVHARRYAGVSPEVNDSLVSLGHLVGAERGITARAVRDHLAAAIDEALLPDLLQYPPFGLYVRVVKGDVRVVHIDPEGDAIGHALPLFDVAEDVLPASLVELLHPVGLDLLLGIDAKLPFHLQLHGQAVRIPATLAQAAVALHGLVSGYHVLEDTG
jgi:hypothetical protein